MQYTAIVKDGGLFIPNITSDVDIVDATVEVFLELPLLCDKCKKPALHLQKTIQKPKAL